MEGWGWNHWKGFALRHLSVAAGNTQRAGAGPVGIPGASLSVCMVSPCGLSSIVAQVAYIVG